MKTNTPLFTRPHSSDTSLDPYMTYGRINQQEGLMKMEVVHIPTNDGPKYLGVEYNSLIGATHVGGFTGADIHKLTPFGTLRHNSVNSHIKIDGPVLNDIVSNGTTICIISEPNSSPLNQGLISIYFGHDIPPKYLSSTLFQPFHFGFITFAQYTTRSPRIVADQSCFTTQLFISAWTDTAGYSTYKYSYSYASLQIFNRFIDIAPTSAENTQIKVYY